MGRKRKINEEQANEIRSSKDSNKSLANRFGTSVQTICSVRHARGAYGNKTNGNPSEPEGSSHEVADLSTPIADGVRTTSNADVFARLFP